jgi:hypothetical protein
MIPATVFNIKEGSHVFLGNAFGIVVALDYVCTSEEIKNLKTQNRIHDYNPLIFTNNEVTRALYIVVKTNQGGYGTPLINYWQLSKVRILPTLLTETQKRCLDTMVSNITIRL